MESFRSRDTELPPSSDTFPLCLTVKELNQRLKELLNFRLPYLWIEGEIANFSYSHNGKVFFPLIEEEASLKALLLKEDRANGLSEVALNNGQKVLAFGKR